jgi:protoporphyrinogen oxidase
MGAAMRKAVIIGGGLTGLAAAVELESLKINYTLIEVKPRLGGSVNSVENNGFIMDSGSMIHQIANFSAFTTYLDSIGLHDSIVETDNGVLFKQGTAALINALAEKIAAPTMMRMAVSSLGTLDNGRFEICMENGMALDTHALLVCAPARYAERMFRTMIPQVSFRLLDYRYEPVTRVSVGYHAGDFSGSTESPDNSPILSIASATHPMRIPEGGVLLQAAVRFDSDAPTSALESLITAMGWSPAPIASHTAHWAESDPIMWRNPKHPKNIEAIQQLLADGVALAGSDMIPTNDPPCIDQQIAQGIAAARRIASFLN